MVVVADAQVAIRGDLEGFKKDLAGAKTQAVTLGDEIRRALSFGALARQGPDALIAGLERATIEADQVNASIRKLADSGRLPAAEARQYADLLEEIGNEAKETAADLKQLPASRPGFDTPAIQAAATALDRVGDEAKETATQLNAMKGVRADTHLERLTQEARQADAALDKVGTRSKGLVGQLNSVKGALAGLGLFIGVQQVLGFFGDATSAASDLNETVSKTSVILGEEALPELERWAAGAAETFGQSRRQALDAAATFAIFGKSAGLAGQDLVGFSTGLAELSSDFASFFNTSPEDAITAIGAALRGESEPIRRYGVLLDEATLRQRALKLGIIETTTQALTPQQRVLAAQAEIFAQSADAQGDFARTSEGLANTQRINAAKIEDAMADLGKALIPLATSLSNLGGEVIPGLTKALEGVIAVLVPFGGLVADHAEIIPILAIALGVGLVRSLDLVAARAKIAGFAFKGILGPLGLLLIAAEALKAGVKPVDDFIGSVIHGAEAMEELRAVSELVGDEVAGGLVASKLREWGVSFEEFARLVESHGGDVQAALQGLADASGDVDVAITDMVDHTASSISGVWTPAMKAAYAAFVGGAGEIRAGAQTGIVDPITDALDDAKAEAVVFGSEFPRDLASAILSGADELDPVAAMIEEIIAGSVSDAATLAENAALLVNPGIASALTGNSKESKAAMLNEVVNPLIESILALEPAALEVGAQIPANLRSAIETNGPLAVQALRDMVGDQDATLAELAVFARERGLDGVASLIEGMIAKKQDATNAGVTVARAAKAEMHFDAYAGGAASAQTFINGMLGTIRARKSIQDVHLALANLRTRTLGGSLPTSGPFAHPETGAISIARAWLDSLGMELSSGLPDIQGSLSDWAGATPMISAAAVPVAAGIVGTGVAGGVTYQYNLSVNGVPYTFESRDDFIKALDDLSDHGAGRVSG